jgi:limonene-1,2-epoxide hydrolase
VRPVVRCGTVAVMREATVAESASDLVRRFCDAWSTRPLDASALATFFSDDAVYHNIPIDPVKGRDAIVQTIAGFTTGVDGIEFRIRHLVASGDVVLTERVDVFTYPHTTVELPVMGTFEVRDGAIVAWRDYFDLNQFMSQVGPAA